MDTIYYVIVGVVGLGLGIWLGWLIGRSKRGEAGRIARLEENVSQFEFRIQELKEGKGEIETQLRSAEGRATQAETRLEAERVVINEAREKFQDAFTTLAGNALRNVSTQFLTKADEKFSSLTKPLTDKLEEYRKLSEKLMQDYGAVDSKLGELDKQTRKLVNVLKLPYVSGSWGEMQLHKLVELMGMSRYCDFSEQETIDETSLRPDMTITLPNNRVVVVDAKNVWKKYIESTTEENEEDRRKKMGEYVSSIRTRISALAKKEYNKQFDRSPEFVIFFLPGEVFFAAAFENDKDLLEYAMNKNILIASPTILASLLFAVAQGWREEALKENAQKIAAHGREIYERLCTMTEHVDNLGGSLMKAMKNHNSLVGSLEHNVLPSARRIKELGISTTRELTVLEEKEVPLRRIQAPELLPGEEPPALPSDENG